jgi:hypothetical protein
MMMFGFKLRTYLEFFYRPPQSAILPFTIEPENPDRNCDEFTELFFHVLQILFFSSVLRSVVL